MKHTIIGVLVSLVCSVVVLAPGVASVEAVGEFSPAEPGVPVDTWAWCGVHPDDPAAAFSAAQMSAVAGIDVTFGPCSDPFGANLPYTPAFPGSRYVAPEVYRRLVDINAAAGMKTVVYDSRVWSTNAATRSEAITFWTPVLADIAAWDMGDEFDPDGPEWDILVERWTVVLADATIRTGVRPFTNQLMRATDAALADLPGSELLLSFTHYDGDLGASVARDHEDEVVITMCGVNAFDHSIYDPSSRTIREDMIALRSAGCDQFLIFGGQRVYGSDNFGSASLVDRQGTATDWAPAVMEGSGRSSYTAVAASRLLETRVGDGLSTIDGDFNGIGKRAESSVLELGVSHRAGVSGRAVSAVLNVTVTNPEKPGFVTVYPCDARPNAAQLNYSAGTTVSATVVAKISDRGSVCIFTLAKTDMVVDVNGFYPEGTTFTSIAPARVLETRPDEGLTTADGQFDGIGRRVGGSVTTLAVGGRVGVPTNARAVALSVTATGSTMPGFVTIFPCGAAVPLVATVNYAGGATVTNATVVNIGASGTVCAYTMTEVDLVVDVTGFHPAGATFASVPPARLLETRTGAGSATSDGLQSGVGLRVADSVTAVQIAGRVGLPRRPGPVVLNITVTEPRRSGYLAVFACGAPRPNAAAINFEAGATVSNMVVAEVGDNGAVCIYTMADLHVVVDVTSYHPSGDSGSVMTGTEGAIRR